MELPFGMVLISKLPIKLLKYGDYSFIFVLQHFSLNLKLIDFGILYGFFDFGVLLLQELVFFLALPD